MKRFRRVTGYLSYHMHLDQPQVLKRLMYHYRDLPIVYIIRNNITGMVYVGSTFVPSLRFHNHLVTGTNSNHSLQAAIQAHGLTNFTVYVMEVVEFSPDIINEVQRKAYLHDVEQFYMDKFPISQLYNDIRSSTNHKR